MASSDIWFPFYISDYIRDTMRLSTEQHGAYLLLLCSFWIDGGTMPDDDKQFAAICRCDPQHWISNLRPVMIRFFIVDNGTWTQKRVKAEKFKAIDKSKVRSEVGKLGGRPRKQMETKPEAIAYANSKQTESPSHSQSDSQSEADSESKSEANYQEVRTSKKQIKFYNEARTLVHYLNEKTGSHFRETDTSLTPIAARLAEPDVTVEGCMVMIDRMCARWKGTTQSEYLRPTTLFGKEKFNEYYAAKDQPVHTNGKPAISKPEHTKGWE